MRPSFRLSFALSLFAAGPLAGQNTFFVDPVRGAPGNPGTIALPLPSLTLAVAMAAPNDTIVALPGEYNDNVETFPIPVPAGVSIQGTSALNTVLISRSLGTSALLRFEPTVIDAYDDVCVDGLTLVAREHCIEISDGSFAGFRIRANPTISNCILIGREAPEPVQLTRWADIDITVTDTEPAFPLHDLDSNGLVENRPKLVNLTLLGVRPMALPRLGILNRVVRTGPGAVTGESQPGILNCLLVNHTSDLEGVDSLDVITSAFATANTAGVSAPLGAAPVPVFNTTTNPPQFVETTLNLVNTALDLRVRPGSPAIDAGSIPAPLAWLNGTTGAATFPSFMDVFDADCEGYGNIRLERAQVDIGADESGELIVAGYERGTTLLSGLNSPFPGFMAFFLNPFPVLPAPFSGLFGVNVTGPGPSSEFHLPWWVAPVPGACPLLSTPPIVIPGVGTQFTVASSVTFTLNFTAPGTPVLLPVSPGATRIQLNWQGIPLVFGGATSPLTNLQSAFN